MSLELIDVLLGHAAFSLNFFHAGESLFLHGNLFLCLLICGVVTGKGKFCKHLVLSDFGTHAYVDARNRVAEFCRGCCLLASFDGAAECTDIGKLYNACFYNAGGLAFDLLDFFDGCNFLFGLGVFLCFATSGKEERHGRNRNECFCNRLHNLFVILLILNIHLWLGAERCMPCSN